MNELKLTKHRWVWCLILRKLSLILNASCGTKDVQRHMLQNQRKCHYLNQSNYFDLDGVDDLEEYIAARREMDVGINSYEQDEITRVCW